MFPSSGSFRNLPCPFHLDAKCDRIYCHYRHIKGDKEKLEDVIELEKLETEICDQLKIDRSTFHLVVNEEDENVHDKLLNNKLKSRFPGNNDAIDDFHFPEMDDEFGFSITNPTLNESDDNLANLTEDSKIEETLNGELEFGNNYKPDQVESDSRRLSNSQLNNSKDDICTQPIKQVRVKEEDPDAVDTLEVDKILSQMEKLNPQIFGIRDQTPLKNEFINKENEQKAVGVDIDDQPTQRYIPSTELNDVEPPWCSKAPKPRINLKSVESINRSIPYVPKPISMPSTPPISVVHETPIVSNITNPVQVARIAEQNRIKNLFKGTICSNIDQFFDMSDAFTVYGTEIFNLLEPLLKYIIEKLNPELNYEKLRKLHSQNITLACSLPFVMPCKHMNECIECGSLLKTAIAKNNVKCVDKSTDTDENNSNSLKKIEDDLNTITKEIVLLSGNMVPNLDDSNNNDLAPKKKADESTGSSSSSRRRNSSSSKRKSSHSSSSRSHSSSTKHKSSHSSSRSTEKSSKDKESKKHGSSSHRSHSSSGNSRRNQHKSSSSSSHKAEKRKKSEDTNDGEYEHKRSKTSVSNKEDRSSSGDSESTSKKSDNLKKYNDNEIDGLLNHLDSDNSENNDCDDPFGGTVSDVSDSDDNEFADTCPSIVSKQRISRVTDSSTLLRQPLQRKKYIAPAEVMFQRQQKSRLAAPNSTEMNGSSSNKIHISHVTNVSNMLKAKEKLSNNLMQTPVAMTTRVQTAGKIGRVAHIPAEQPQPKNVPVRANTMRPQIEDFKTANNIPSHVRQDGLDRLYNTFVQKVPPEIAHDLALKEEKTIHEKVTTQKIYMQSLVMSIHRISKENPAKLTEIKSEFPLEINGFLVYDMLSKYILTIEQMEINGFPLALTGKPGCSYISTKAIHYKALSSKRCGDNFYCQQCKGVFEMSTETGLPITPITGCQFHTLRARKEAGRTNHAMYYPCCNRSITDPGCNTAKYHTPDTTDDDCLEGFIETREASPGDRGQKTFYALDCEMCYTTVGSELTRVTVIGHDCKIVYDSLVKPKNKILDYCTKFSGITEEKMKKATKNLEQVRKELFKFTFKDTILIGHSLENDLKALKIIHHKIVDTSVMFPHRDAPERKFSLKSLSSSVIQFLIQESEFGHDSMEDALACMKLVWKKIKDDAKTYRPKKIIETPSKK